MAGSESIDFIPKSKAIGLPLLQKIAGSKSTDFISKDNAIGLPLFAKK